MAGPAIAQRRVLNLFDAIDGIEHDPFFGTSYAIALKTRRVIRFGVVTQDVELDLEFAHLFAPE
jgi:hypothetical protein